jgi:hypothetical protein
MNPRTTLLTAGTLAFAAACEPEPAPRVGDLEVSAAGIVQYVRNGQHKTWTADPAPRASIGNGPHGRVWVFFNPTIEASLRGGGSVHPAGSILVKEVYAEDGVTVTTHLLDVKTSEGSGKERWVFYEGSPPDYRSPYFGRALPVCTGCHADGNDFVLSPLP